MNRIGIVIVTWNSQDHIEACLNAARKWCPEILVVDNASTDQTVKLVRRHGQARLIQNPTNRGFAAAVNQGIAALQCDLSLLLNPDVTLETDIEPLARACQQDGVAAAAGRLLNADGTDQAGFMVRRFPTALTLALEVTGCNRLWPGNPVNRRYRCRDADWNVEADVEQPAGALLMIRHDVWRQLGGFDESFHPLWFEDVDMLRRVAKNGFRVRYIPEMVARHHGGHTAAQLSFGCRTTYWYDSLLRYASKHFGGSGRVLVCASVALGSLVRLSFSLLRERSMQPLVVYPAVIRLVAGFLIGAPRGFGAKRSPAGTTGTDRVTLRTPD